MLISERDPRTIGRRGLPGAVARRPMRVFFTLAFALSWLAWTPYVLSQDGLGLTPLRFPVLLGDTQVFGVLPGAYLGPITAAFIVTAVVDGRAGLRRWAGRMLRWRVNWRWYAVIIVGVPLALGLTTIPFSGGRVEMPSLMVLAVFLPALLFQMVTTGLAEEPGWRDFALPRLQPRYGPLRANLILGPLWGMWHLPLFLTDWGGWPDVAWWEPVEFVATTFMFSLFMTWVFNRTGESLPLAMLLHTSVNNFLSTLWTSIFPNVGPDDSTHVFLIASTAAATIMLVATRGRIGWNPGARVNPARRP